MAKDIKCDIIDENTADEGVTVENVKLKDSFIELPEIATPANAPTDKIRLYFKSDGNIYVLDEAGAESQLQKSAGAAAKSAFYRAEANSNYNNYRTRSVGTGGNHRFTFDVPDDFATLVYLWLVGAPTGGAAGAAKDIDLASNYGRINQGESVIFNQETDTASTYDFSGLADTWVGIDISGVFSSLVAGHSCGVLVDHNGIGGSIEYRGIRIGYT